MSQSNVQVNSGTGPEVAMYPVTWNAVSSNMQAMVPADPNTLVPLFPTSAAAIVAAAAAGAVKTGAGRLFGVVITAVGASPFTITDGATGTVLATFPANAAVGDYIPAYSKPFSSSLYCNTGTGTPAFTVLYS